MKSSDESRKQLLKKFIIPGWSEDLPRAYYHFHGKHNSLSCLIAVCGNDAFTTIQAPVAELSEIQAEIWLVHAQGVLCSWWEGKRRIWLVVVADYMGQPSRDLSQIYIADALEEVLAEDQWQQTLDDLGIYFEEGALNDDPFMDSEDEDELTSPDVFQQMIESDPIPEPVEPAQPSTTPAVPDDPFEEKVRLVWLTYILRLTGYCVTVDRLATQSLAEQLEIQSWAEAELFARHQHRLILPLILQGEERVFG